MGPFAGFNAMKDAIGKATEQARSVEVARIEGQLAGARARAGSIRAQMRQVEGELNALDGTAGIAGPQARGRPAGTEPPDLFLKLEESLIMDDMDRQKMVAVSVVQKATVPAFPKKQKLNKKPDGRRGLLRRGLAAGIALAIILEPYDARHADARQRGEEPGRARPHHGDKEMTARRLTKKPMRGW